jgi:hypothetical protein
MAVAAFATVSLATAFEDHLTSILPNKAAYTLDAIVFVYYYLRGFCVTSIYVWVKHNFAQADAEKLSSNLGLMGQIGALISNSVMFILLAPDGTL